MTQTASVSRIVSLNEYWNPAAIYVDAGFGGMQVEQLRLYGATHSKSGLYDKVIPVAMNSKIQVTDPATGVILDKHAKEFIIDMSARELEEGRIMLPKSEDNYEGEYGLVGQLRNFKVDKFTESGHRKFSDGKDHAIVAWALAITAMALEHSESPLSSGLASEIKYKLVGSASVYRPDPNANGEDDFSKHNSLLKQFDSNPNLEQKNRTTPVDRENITDARLDMPLKNTSVNIYDMSKGSGDLKKRMSPPKRKLW
jgi:hypothetical protein